MVLEIKKKINFFLRVQLQLQVKEACSKIIDVYSRKVRFFGIFIYNVIDSYAPFYYKSFRKLEYYRKQKLQLINRIASFNSRRRNLLRNLIFSNV